MRDVLTQQATQINELAQHNHCGPQQHYFFSKTHKTKRVTIGGHEEVRPILTAPNKSLPSSLKLMVVIHQTSVKLSKKCKVCGELVRPDEMARHRRDSTELHVQLLEDMLEACSAHTNP